MATEGPGLQEGAALRDGCAPSGIRQPGRSARCGPTQGKCPGEGNSQEHGSTFAWGGGRGGAGGHGVLCGVVKAS